MPTRRDLDLAPPPQLTPEQRLRLALELADAGIAMKRRALRRADPDADEATLDARLRAWLAEPR